ncbi:MAG: hypothetical protein HY647_08120 [Acidobacteria bacterium]|nr:hypothetical protein [Acidobacteriota bacterium]
MRKPATQWLARIGVILQLLLGSSFALGQTKEIEITVDHAHPMGAAILKLQELSGIPINDEDMPVYYSGDLKDVTDQARTPPLPGERLYAPLGGQLSFSIAVDEVTGKLNDVQAVKDALSKLIAAYNSSDLPGSFDFEEYNGVFFVRPVSYRDATGATQPMKPLLATPITLPEEKRVWTATIRLILQQLSKAAGVIVGDATYPLRVGTEVTIGANNEPADRLIARVLVTVMCTNSASAACTPPNSISETVWDVGYSYGLGYAPGYGYMFGIRLLKNSRWLVPPPPSKPYSPPPSRGVKPGTRVP